MCGELTPAKLDSRTKTGNFKLRPLCVYENKLHRFGCCLLYMCSYAAANADDLGDTVG